VLAATSDADPSVAQAALDVLGARRDPRAAPRAERLVGSTQPAIRGAAARALVLLDALPLRRAAVERALADREPAVQLAVLDGFRENPTPEAIRYLERLAANPDPRVRAAVARALAANADPRARASLRTFPRDPEPEIRGMAVGALGDLRDPAESSALAALAKDPAEAVRVAVAGALGKAGDRGAMG